MNVGDIVTYTVKVNVPATAVVGDTVTVKCSEIDKQGRVNLTRIGLEDTPIIKAGEEE